MLEKIQEIGQEQDPGPDKVLAKLQPGSRKMKKTVKFWIKSLVVGEKMTKKQNKNPQATLPRIFFIKMSEKSHFYLNLKINKE